MSRTISIACMLGAILLGSLLPRPTVLFRQAVAGDAAQTAPEPMTEKSEQAARVYELRIYTAAEGKMESLNRRFRDHTLRLFEKHGIESIGYWTGADELEQQKLYYLVAYPDRASRDNMLIKGIAADPEFHKVVAESEKDGTLTTKVESVILVPTDYSPLK